MSDGMGCKCAASCGAECCCDVDWTPGELVEARVRIKELETELAWREIESRKQGAEAIRTMANGLLKYSGGCGLLPHEMLEYAGKLEMLK